MSATPLLGGTATRKHGRVVTRSREKQPQTVVLLGVAMVDHDHPALTALPQRYSRSRAWAPARI